MTFTQLLREEKRRLLAPDVGPRDSLRMFQGSIKQSITTFSPPEFAAAVLCCDVAAHLLDQVEAQPESAVLRQQVRKLVQTCEGTVRGRPNELISLARRHHPDLVVDVELFLNGHSHDEILADPWIAKLAADQDLLPASAEGKERSIDEIIEQHLLNDRIVERLKI